MDKICPTKFEQFTRGVPEGSVEFVLPVLITGPGADRIACTGDCGIRQEELGNTEAIIKASGGCALWGELGAEAQIAR